MVNKKSILYILLAACILAVGIFAFFLIREILIDSQGRSFFTDLTAEIEFRPRSPGHGGHGGGTETGTSETGDIDDTTPQTDLGNDWVPYVDFDALSIELPGITGWIVLDDSPINFPIMQDSDNEFFIKHLPDGTPHRNGSIFLDYRNKNDFSDKSILIYGHMTKDHDMFGILREYRNQRFYDANPVLYLYTPDRDYTIVLFAATLAHSQRDHPPLQFEGNQFLQYVEQLKRDSFFRSNVDISADDRIVSLCTCAYDFNEARLILTGVLVGW